MTQSYFTISRSENEVAGKRNRKFTIYSLTSVENGKRVNCVTVFFAALSYQERRIFPQIFSPQTPKLLFLKRRFQKQHDYCKRKRFSSPSFLTETRILFFPVVELEYLFTWRRRGLGELLCHSFRRDI